MRENKVLNITLTILSILVGLLFIFSGLVKANDPSGLAYKMSEFFEVWANEGYMPSLMHWLNKYVMSFSILMIAFEIIAGVALVIGYRFKLFSFLILLLTIFFTFLTGYAVYSGKIKECGCFGDCIKLQANESFMKDLIILAVILILFFFRSKVKQLFKAKPALYIMLVGTLSSFLFQWYVLRNLPIKDCLAYKVGNNILTEMTPGENYVPAEYKTILTYEKDGVKKDFTTTDFPWQDTTWKFVEQKNELVKEAQNEPTIKDFAINNYNGENVTEQVLRYPGYVFLLFIKNVNEAKTQNMDGLRLLISACKKAEIPILALSGSNDIESNAFKNKHQLDIEFYGIDVTVCKTAIRTNPGLILLQQGTIKGKWSYLNYPDLTILKLNENVKQTPLFPQVESVAPVTETDSILYEN